MNPRHLTAIAIMRWQMMRNRFRKSGKINWIVTVVLIGLGAMGSLSAFIFTAGFGSFLLDELEPFQVIYVWDALVFAFLVFWLTGLLTELQQTQVLSLKNLLHLPVSLRGAFFLNYAASLVGLTTILVVPIMLGLCVASIIHFGPRTLIVFALLAAFVFMVSSVSYQFRGWLGQLMENKRTRGTVIALVTVAFVLLCQAPTLLRFTGDGNDRVTERRLTAKHFERVNELKQKQASGELDEEQYVAQFEAAEEVFEQEKDELRAANQASWNRTATMVNLALPVGWLPYGAAAVATGRSLAISLLCLLGMSTIGTGSLAMAYRAAMRLSTGEHKKRYRAAAKTRDATGKPTLLERQIPGLTNIQSSIALATFRSTLRAPEAKMALLTPLVFAFIFATTVYGGPMAQLPSFVRPWFGIGAIGMSIVGMTQMMLNMFGLDRQGFRAYVLMPVPRQDILLGKNLGILPIAGTLSTVLIIAVGVIGKMDVFSIVASLVQMIIAFMAYWTISNHTSIFAPLGMAPGSMKPVAMKFSVIAIQFLALLLIPLALLPATLTLMVDLLARYYDVLGNVPVYLVLSLIELPIAYWIYRQILIGQGQQLEQREQKILEVVSKVAD